MDQVYRCKADAWLVVVLALARGVSLAAVISIGAPASVAHRATIASCVVLGTVLPYGCSSARATSSGATACAS